MKTRFLLPAYRELREALRYYNMQRVLLGEEFNVSRNSPKRGIRFPCQSVVVR